MLLLGPSIIPFFWEGGNQNQLIFKDSSFKIVSYVTLKIDIELRVKPDDVKGMIF